LGDYSEFELQVCDYCTPVELHPLWLLQHIRLGEVHRC
jgi:hypothetical protein